VYPNSLHPIVKNLGGIKFDFANPIDTLKTELRKHTVGILTIFEKIGTPTR
jgi:hypothetical protein